MHTTPQEDCLLVEALIRLAHDYDGSPDADRARALAEAIAAEHGLTVVDAVLQHQLPVANRRY